LTAPIFK